MNARLAVVETKVEMLQKEMRAIHELRGMIIALQTTQENMSGMLIMQSKDIKALNDMSSRGKGALAVFVVVGGAITGIAAWLVNHFTKM